MDPVARLEEAVKHRNAYEVEDALCEDYDSSRSEEYVAVLIELLGHEWHIKHEDIALELQRLRDPEAIGILRITAERKFGYLDFDDSKALARKCTWALADIGTEDARIALKEIAQLPDEEVAGYAQKRLERWEQEKERKRA